jgi:hypothetical protein
MTKMRNGSFIKRAKDISIGSALVVTLLAGTPFFTSCSSSNKDNDADYSYEETTYSKGIRSHIKEVKPGEFKITDEETVAPDQSMAIVSYLDGHTDSLTTSAAKALIDQDYSTNNQTNVSHNSGGGLSSMLLYGGMGYMLARTMGGGYMNNLRNSNPAAQASAYSNPTAYNKSQNVVKDVNASRSTRTVSSRPSGGKSGFFGGSSARNAS